MRFCSFSFVSDRAVWAKADSRRWAFLQGATLQDEKNSWKSPSFTAGSQDLPYIRYRGYSNLFISCSPRLSATLLIAISPQIYGALERPWSDITCIKSDPTANMSTWCYHEGHGLWYFSRLVLIICFGPIGDVLRPPFLFRLQPLFLMSFTTLLFSTPLFAPCRCMVCHLQGAHWTKVGTTPMPLSTDAIHFFDLHRPLLVFHATWRHAVSSGNYQTAFLGFDFAFEPF